MGETQTFSNRNQRKLQIKSLPISFPSTYDTHKKSHTHCGSKQGIKLTTVEGAQLGKTKTKITVEFRSDCIKSRRLLIIDVLRDK